MNMEEIKELLVVSSPKKLPKNFTGCCRVSGNGDNDGLHWYKNGKSHREGGPAKIFLTGVKQWWYEGLLHRLDGPCIEARAHRELVAKKTKYRIHGEPFTKEQYYKQPAVILMFMKKLET